MWRQFLAVASGDFRHSMCIPWEVGSHLGSMITETIKLEAPNGIFHIGVCRKMGELVLQTGWDRFVAVHHIKENYSFLFVYRGNSTFKVHIFNSNGHEKATSGSQPPSQRFGCVPPGTTCDHHVLNDGIIDPPPHTGYYVSSSDDDHIGEEGYYVSSSDDDHIGEEGYYVSSSDDDRIGEEGYYVSSCDDDHIVEEGYYVSSLDDDHIVDEGTRKSCGQQKQAPSRCAKAQKVASTSSPSAAKSGREAHKLNERASVEFGVDLEPHSSSNLEGPSQHPYILSEGRTPLSSVEKKKVEEKVQAIQSELPIFVAVMTKSRINSHQLGICKEYGRHIPHINRRTDLVLQAEGGTEQRTRLVLHDNGVKWIRSGWKKFVDENGVQVGDIALFEQAKSTEKLRMTVYFVRKSELLSE